MLVILEHIEAGTGRGQQHRIHRKPVIHGQSLAAWSDCLLDRLNFGFTGI